MMESSCTFTRHQPYKSFRQRPGAGNRRAAFKAVLIKRSAAAFLLPLILLLSGCAMPQSTGAGAAPNAGSNVTQAAGSNEDQNSAPNAASSSEDTVYRSHISPEDCYLCGGGLEKRIPSHWGQNNIALFSLNTFEISTLEITLYDGHGQPLEEYAGFMTVGGAQGKNGGFWSNFYSIHDRGYAKGSIIFNDDAVLDTGKTADFLCEACLNEILPRQTDRCFGVGAIHLATKDVCIFTKNSGNFILGDFYIDCHLKIDENLPDRDSDQQCMDVLVFYCPIRYEKES